MHCDVVQRALIAESPDLAPTVEVEAHLRGCAACRRLQATVEGIELALITGPAWEPPPGFARTVAVRSAARVARGNVGVPQPPRGVWALNAAAVTLAAVVLLSLLLFEPLVAWFLANPPTAIGDGMLRAADRVTSRWAADPEGVAWLTAVAFCFGVWRLKCRVDRLAPVGRA